MSRPLRIELADGVYHVTCRGLEKLFIVRDDIDRHKWTGLLARAATRCGWRVLAWALMDNHYHLFVRTPGADLSAGMHDINSGYATWFNHRHGRCGPLFQGRFKSILVEREFHYWELSRYIHLNPVRAGLSATPEDYPWSSCAWYFRSRGTPQWLAPEETLALHGQTLRAARRAYREFLADGMKSPQRSPLLDAFGAAVLGTAGFVERIRTLVNSGEPDAEVPAAKAFLPRISLADIAQAVCKTYGASPDLLSRRGKHGNEARDAAIYLARTLTPATVAEIGAHFGGITAAAVSRTSRRVLEIAEKNKRFASKLQAVEVKIAKKYEK